MPERTEIEAAAEAIRDTYVALGTRSGRFGSVGLLDERSRIRIAEVILDRVRDARGDDETTYPPDRLTAGEAPRPAEWEAWQARSPQGEDHEPCPTCGGRGWHTAGGNDPMACGRCEAGERWSQGEDHETSVPRQSDAPTERNRERPDDPVGTGEGHSPPQGEDPEAGR